MKKLIVSATAAIFAAGSAFAQLPVKPSASPEEIQEKLDAGVPYVIRQKMPLDGTTTFHLNGDGELSQEEFVEYTIKEARAKAENTFNGFDTDHNGSLSEEEYLAALQKMMRRLAEQIKSSVQNMSETE